VAWRRRPGVQSFARTVHLSRSCSRAVTERMRSAIGGSDILSRSELQNFAIAPSALPAQPVDATQALNLSASRVRFVGRANRKTHAPQQTRWLFDHHLESARTQPFLSPRSGVRSENGPTADIASRARSPRLHKRTRAYSGNPAFRRPSMYSFAFDVPPRVMNADIVKAGSTSSRRAAASRASASRPR
jgi:hypothetical protein